MIRILVTGSRTWRDRIQVGEELVRAVTDLGGVIPHTPVTLISGACPQGADRIAEELAASWGWTVERHVADWNTHGRAAGPIRNQAMVDLGADVCLVFRKDGSRGATGCGQAAEQAGIPTRWFEAA